MDETHDTDVVAVLLGYGRLNSSQRKAFTNMLNNFVYGSPKSQRGMLDRWSALCGALESPQMKMVAESPATYLSGPKKRRKPKPST